MASVGKGSTQRLFFDGFLGKPLRRPEQLDQQFAVAFLDPGRLLVSRRRTKLLELAFDGADPRFDDDLGILLLRHSPRRLRRAFQRRFVIVEDGESALDLGR